SSIRSTLILLVVRGITAIKGKPRRRAKYASLTAVEPDEASIILVPLSSHPLHSAYTNRERANRCFKLPVGCLDSSLRYKSMPYSSGSGNLRSGVSPQRVASASILCSAQATH